MQDIFSLNSDVSATTIKDTIYSHIHKVKAILTCVMFAIEFIQDDKPPDNNTVYNTLWAADDYLDELEKLLQRLE